MIKTYPQWLKKSLSFILAICTFIAMLSLNGIAFALGDTADTFTVDMPKEKTIVVDETIPSVLANLNKTKPVTTDEYDFVVDISVPTGQADENGKPIYNCNTSGTYYFFSSGEKTDYATNTRIIVAENVNVYITLKDITYRGLLATENSNVELNILGKVVNNGITNAVGNGNLIITSDDKTSNSYTTSGIFSGDIEKIYYETYFKKNEASIPNPEPMKTYDNGNIYIKNVKLTSYGPIGSAPAIEYFGGNKSTANNVNLIKIVSSDVAIGNGMNNWYAASYKSYIGGIFNEIVMDDTTVSQTTLANTYNINLFIGGISGNNDIGNIILNNSTIDTDIYVGHGKINKVVFSFDTGAVTKIISEFQTDDEYKNYIQKTEINKISIYVKQSTLKITAFSGNENYLIDELWIIKNSSVKFGYIGKCNNVYFYNSTVEQGKYINDYTDIQDIDRSDWVPVDFTVQNEYVYNSSLQTMAINLNSFIVKDSSIFCNNFGQTWYDSANVITADNCFFENDSVYGYVENGQLFNVKTLKISSNTIINCWYNEAALPNDKNICSLASDALGNDSVMNLNFQTFRLDNAKTRWSGNWINPDLYFVGEEKTYKVYKMPDELRNIKNTAWVSINKPTFDNTRIYDYPEYDNGYFVTNQNKFGNEKFYIFEAPHDQNFCQTLFNLYTVDGMRIYSQTGKSGVPSFNFSDTIESTMQGFIDNYGCSPEDMFYTKMSCFVNEFYTYENGTLTSGIKTAAADAIEEIKNIEALAVKNKEITATWASGKNIRLYSLTPLEGFLNSVMIACDYTTEASSVDNRDGFIFYLKILQDYISLSSQSSEWDRDSQGAGYLGIKLLTHTDGMFGGVQEFLYDENQLPVYTGANAAYAADVIRFKAVNNGCYDFKSTYPMNHLYDNCTYFVAKGTSLKNNGLSVSEFPKKFDETDKEKIKKTTTPTDDYYTTGYEIKSAAVGGYTTTQQNFSNIDEIINSTTLGSADIDTLQYVSPILSETKCNIVYNTNNLGNIVCQNEDNSQTKLSTYTVEQPYGYSIDYTDSRNSWSKVHSSLAKAQEQQSNKYYYFAVNDADNVFLGWQDENGVLYDFSAPVTSNITLTPKVLKQSQQKIISVKTEDNSTESFEYFLEKQSDNAGAGAPQQPDKSQFSFNESDWTINADGYITGYNGDDYYGGDERYIGVPDTINGIAVKGFAPSMDSSGLTMPSYATLYIPKGITNLTFSFDTLMNMMSATKISASGTDDMTLFTLMNNVRVVVDADNPVYSSYDGSLLSKDGSYVYYIGANSFSKDKNLPTTVTGMSAFAMYGNILNNKVTPSTLECLSTNEISLNNFAGSYEMYGELMNVYFYITGYSVGEAYINETVFTMVKDSDMYNKWLTASQQFITASEWESTPNELAQKYVKVVEGAKSSFISTASPYSSKYLITDTNKYNFSFVNLPARYKEPGTYTFSPSTDIEPYTFNLELKKGTLNITTTDESDNSVYVIGMVYTITNISTGEKILMAASNDLGLSIYENLPYGDYSVSQTSCTGSWAVGTTAQTFSITEDGQVVNLNFTSVVAYVNCYSVSVPKTIIIDGSTGTAGYSVGVKGSLNPDLKLTVKPIANISLTSADTVIDKKKDITAHVSQQKSEWIAGDLIEDDVWYSTSGEITAQLSAGRWYGVLNFTISIS